MIHPISEYKTPIQNSISNNFSTITINHIFPVLGIQYLARTHTDLMFFLAKILNLYYLFS